MDIIWEHKKYSFYRKQEYGTPKCNVKKNVLWSVINITVSVNTQTNNKVPDQYSFLHLVRQTKLSYLNQKPCTEICNIALLKKAIFISSAV